MIEGGTRPNVVAERTVLEVDLRAVDRASMEAADAAIRALAAAPAVPDVTIDVELRHRHWPMEKLPRSGRLVELAQGLAAGLGFEVRDAATGGASDANTTAGLGVPSLDGLGPIGGHGPLARRSGWTCRASSRGRRSSRRCSWRPGATRRSARGGRARWAEHGLLTRSRLARRTAMRTTATNSPRARLRRQATIAAQATTASTSGPMASTWLPSGPSPMSTSDGGDRAEDRRADQPQVLEGARRQVLEAGHEERDRPAPGRSRRT